MILGCNWDRVIKFTRWQHPTVGREARLAVTGSTCVKKKLYVAERPLDSLALMSVCV